jgi:hypothetical protein
MLIAYAIANSTATNLLTQYSSRTPYTWRPAEPPNGSFYKFRVVFTSDPATAARVLLDANAPCISRPDKAWVPALSEIACLCHDVAQKSLELVCSFILTAKENLKCLLGLCGYG